MAVTIAEIAAPVSAAAAEDQDEDDDKPQAGAVIVSVVEPHESHLALSLFYALAFSKEPGRLKNPRMAGKCKFPFLNYREGRDGGFHV